MNKYINKSELGEMVAKQKGFDAKVVNKFIEQFFASIEEQLVTESSVKVDVLGTFRIIKSGSSNRILFLGQSCQEKPKREPGIANKIPPASVVDKIVVSESEKSQVTTNRVETTANEIAKELAKLSIETSPTTSKPILLSKVENSVENIPANSARQDIAKPIVPDSTEQEREPYRVPAQHTHSNSKRKIGYVLLFALTIFVFLIVGWGIYSYIKGYKKISTSNAQNNTEISIRSFLEMDNTDKQNLSRIILTKEDVSVKDIAKVYYGNELFWPFIYKANTTITDKNLMIQTNSIVRIPKLSVDLVQYSTGMLNQQIKDIGKQTLDKINNGQN
jgi:nucleoid-associated protein YgaU